MRRLLRHSFDVVAVAAVYWAAAALSLQVALVSKVVTPVWPPTGIALVALLVLGRRAWPGIALGAFLVNLPRTPSPLAAAIIALGNTLAPVIAAELLRRLSFRTELDRFRDGLALVAVGIVSMAVSATVGTGTLWLGGTIRPGGLLETWSVWWAGDATGVLLFAPLLLSFASAGRRARESPTGRPVEAVILAICLVTVSALAFSGTYSKLPMPFLIFPFVVWAAARFGLRGGSIATLVAAGFAIRAAVENLGPFAGVALADKMLNLQTFDAAAALTSLMLAAAVAERARTAQALRRATEELEQRVEERTAELVQSNERLIDEVEARQRAQEAAEQKGRQLADAERLAQTGSWEWDLASKVVRWSDQMYRIYGHEPQSFPVVYGGGSTRQTVPEDQGRIAQDLAARLAAPTAEHPPFEYRIIRPDGEERLLVGKGSVVLGADGKPVRMVGSIQDITETRRAEEALRTSEEMFRSLFESAATGMAQCEPATGRFIKTNEAYRRLLQCQEDQLAGMTLFAGIHPDDRPNLEELFERLVRGDIPWFELVARWQRSDGVWLWLDCSVALARDGEGRSRFVQTVVQDLTERRRAEEQFTQFFNLSLDLMIVAGFDGYIKRVNPAFERLFGYKVEELVGRPYLELIHPDEHQRIFEQLAALASGEDTKDIEFRSQGKNGAWHWCLWSAAPIPEEGVIYAVGVDITERKRAAELLQESEERYRRLVEHAPEAIVVLDLDAGHFVDANAEAERLFGLSRDELYRVGPADVSPALQPDGRPSHEEAMLRYGEALHGETPQFEWVHRDAEDREVLCEVRLLHLPAEDRRLVRGSLMDITERRRVEKALEETAERERALRLQQEIAQTLQSSLLPDRLPDVPGLTLAARYVPGSAGLEVGGDWYDVFPLPGGAVALAIGDIVGRGLQAAATMGQLRTALRAYALEGLSPATTVERLGGLAQTLPEAEMATLIYAVYQPDAGVLSFVSAGHPPPLLVRSDGTTDFLEEGRSSPLGVTGYPASEAMVALEPGSILLLYTDGLVERRGRQLDEGLAALARAAAGRAEDPPEAVCDAVMGLMAGDGGPQDDVALMVLSLAPRHAERFRFAAAAEPQHLAPLRRALSRWLSEAGATKEETDDIVLAISEAAANAVLHAYGPEDGTFEIMAKSTGGVIDAAVRDRGRWRFRGPDQGGRGIRLMRALVDSTDIVSGPSGTEVRLTRRLGRPLGPPVPEQEPSMPAAAPSSGEVDEGVAVVRVTEEMDFSNAEPMGAELARAVSSEHLGLVVDLSGVTLLDSSGLRLLFRLGRRLERRRQQLRVVAPLTSPVRRVLDIAGIWSGSHVARSVEEAVASIREHPAH